MAGDDQPPCPSPSPSLLRDISNFKTPKRSSIITSKFILETPNPQQFFSAFRQTPKSSYTSSFRRPKTAAAAAAAKRLRSFEIEQSQSSRKEQLKKERKLRSLAKSLTIWLNFLFENPRSCGCDTSIDFHRGYGNGGSVKGKRDSGEARGAVVGVDAMWRSPKRLREMNRSQEQAMESGNSSRYLALSESLKEVCSFDDLKQRMSVYLSLGSCKEVLDVMTRVAKNIDERRIKMKPHCPIVTDVAMKEKAIRTLMCYNPVWLRIGLYIIFGGDSLLSDVDVNSDQETAFLKMVIEKQFFSHAVLAKAYAYNKMVEGLYRPGYYEALGIVILKRILLLVLILDRAKSHSSLSFKYGLDGTDGGSPLLFSAQSSIKSSHHVINNFLSSDVMHGEGNLLAHLVIVGYQVSYQQSPLVEYNFKVTDLFVDLQDGVRLCRAIQLLLQQPSILTKVVVPSDNRRKNLANCGLALHYLKQAGVPLKDDEGMTVMENDVANGDKELTLSLLWNMFVHLQMPLLISKTLIAEEISKVRGQDVIDQSNFSSSPSDVILNWIQAICEKYDSKVENFASLADGKGIWCLLDYYFRREICCPCLHAEDSNETRGPRSVMSNTDYTDAVHNFILSQKLTALLGSFPEVLQVGDLLEHNAAISDRSVMILLAFLSSRLTIKENMDKLNFHKLLCSNCQALERRHSRIRYSSSGVETSVEEVDGHDAEDAAQRFKAIKTWWQEMANQNYNPVVKTTCSTSCCISTSRSSMDIRRENAAIVLQSYLRGFLDRRKFAKMKAAVFFLQTVTRTWLSAKQVPGKCSAFKVNDLPSERWIKSETLRRYVKFIAERHQFIKLRKSVLLIQHAVRTWMACRHESAISITDNASDNQINLTVASHSDDCLVESQDNGWAYCEVEAACKLQLAWRAFHHYKCRSQSAIIIQSYIRGWIARRKAWRDRYLTIIIQKYCRGWLVRRQFLLQRKAAIKIQSAVQCSNCLRSFQRYKNAAIEVQRFVRGQIARRRILGASWFCAAICNDFSRFSTQNLEIKIILSSLVKLQRWWRGIMSLKLKTQSAILIQRHIRGFIARRKASRERHQIIFIKSHRRGYVICKEPRSQLMDLRLRPQNSAASVDDEDCLVNNDVLRFASVDDEDRLVNNDVSKFSNQNLEMKIALSSVVKLQKWWRRVMSVKSKTKSAILVQRHIRGFIARRKASREMHQIIMIQSHWKGYLARKESRSQLMDLRLRMQNSAANADDKNRLINRLLSALAELLNMKSVHNILHVCETLDTATRYSQKCCEELVAAGAIDKLLTVIRSASRSIPDQEVAKHALSTLRNLARYPHLTEVLVNSKGSIQTIFWELLRNKEEGYFIASEVLRKICANHKGVEAVRKLPALLKRLHSLVEELSRKAAIGKRNARATAGRENRRLKEAAEILKLITGR